MDRPKQEFASGSGVASSTCEAGSAHSKTVTASDSNPDCVFLSLNCIELPLEGSGRNATGLGFGPKFGTSDLKELSRRSGLSLPKLQEALLTLKEYRIKHC